MCEKIQAFGETRTPRTDKSITKEDATAFLTAMKNAIFDELGVELPPITDAMIANLTGENYSRTGGCGGVVNALTENLIGYLPVDKVNQGYSNVVSGTVSGTIFEIEQEQLVNNEFRGDHFDENGSFLYKNYPDIKYNSGSYTGYGLVIVNTTSGQKILNRMVFSQSNAKILAGIAKHYAQQLGLDVAKLTGSEFSVTVISPNSGTSVCNSLYNIGSCGSSNIMNTDIEKHYISIQVNSGQAGSYMGSISNELEYIGNFKSTIFHEWQHLLGLGGDETSHLTVYKRQVTDATYKLVTPIFVKDVVTKNVQDLINLLIKNSKQSEALQWKTTFIRLEFFQKCL